MVVRYKNRGRLIFARPRTGPQSAHISGGRRWLSVPIAHSLGSCAMGQTDGRIALLQNAPPQGAGIKILTTVLAPDVEPQRNARQRTAPRGDMQRRLIDVNTT